MFEAMNFMMSLNVFEPQDFYLKKPFKHSKQYSNNTIYYLL